jgi:hypothetical protein
MYAAVATAAPAAAAAMTSKVYFGAISAGPISHRSNQGGTESNASSPHICQNYQHVLLHQAVFFQCNAGPLDLQTFLRLCVIKSIGKSNAATPPCASRHTLDKKYFCSFRRPAYQRAKAAAVVARCKAASQVQ